MNNRTVIARRNIRRKNQEITSKPVASIKLCSKGLGKYVLPRLGEFEPGIYFSTVKEVRWTTTRSTGTLALEVFYEMKSGINCIRIARGLLPSDAENKSFYVKQIYPINLTPYNNFADSMAESLGLYNGEEFDIEDIIGQTEYLKWEYRDKGDLCSITARCPMSRKEFIKLCKGEPIEDSIDEEYSNEDTEECEDDYVEPGYEFDF